jgi:hypothetical protein
LQTRDSNQVSAEQKGPYSSGGFYASKTGKTNEERNKNIVASADADERKVGISKASLELLDVSIDDILKSRNENLEDPNLQNPILKVASSKSTARTNKKNDKKNHDELTRSNAISGITFGSYALEAKVLKKKTSIKIQNPINSNRSFLKDKRIENFNTRKLSVIICRYKCIDYKC